jgi:hypothetical protein
MIKTCVSSVLERMTPREALHRVSTDVKEEKNTTYGSIVYIYL